jgi:hypothetical protein
MFDRFDHNHDGMLQRHEFVAALSLLGLTLSSQQLDLLMTLLVHPTFFTPIYCMQLCSVIICVT